jgi:hypothetical protein
MEETNKLLRHVLAALAYRTQKALRGAPEAYSEFRAARGVRTPWEIVRHMTSVLGYARTFFEGGTYEAVALASFPEEVERLHRMMEDLGRHFSEGRPLQGTTPERMLQGPLSDAMTHAGQLALLRRLSGLPVPPENFIFAEISPDNLSPDQPDPASPDRQWHEPQGSP